MDPKRMFPTFALKKYLFLSFGFELVQILNNVPKLGNDLEDPNKDNYDPVERHSRDLHWRNVIYV